MPRAFLLIRLTLVLVGLASTSAASAAGGASDSRKSSHTFTMVNSAAAPGSRTIASSAGASLAPKAVVSNPYNVPLLKDAGSLRSTR
ncbi:MAG: hypothetical protein ABIQ33_07810 [Caldimonas sp.]